MQIYKYPLVITGIQTVGMPVQAKILSAQWQHNTIMLWALVPDDPEMSNRIFRVYGTGHYIENVEKLQYIGTIQEPTIQEPYFVWHVFEETNDE